MLFCFSSIRTVPLSHKCLNREKAIELLISSAPEYFFVESSWLRWRAIFTGFKRTANRTDPRRTTLEKILKKRTDPHRRIHKNT